MGGDGRGAVGNEWDELLNPCRPSREAVGVELNDAADGVLVG